MRVYSLKKCLRCQKEFQPSTNGQKYCGSDRKKTGCSYKMKMVRNKIKNRRIPKYCKLCNKLIQRGDFKKICNECRRERSEKTNLLKLRFKILERDNFTCQYCGRKAPETILEIDHNYPESKGGTNKRNNLITSCRECNRGKGDIILKKLKD